MSQSTGSSEGAGAAAPRRIAAQLDREAAAQATTPRRRWLRRTPRVVALELVRLPVHLFRVRVEVFPKDRRTALLVSVDAIDGTVRRLDESLETDMPATDDAAEETFAARVDVNSAERTLRHEFPLHVLQVALRSASAMHIDEVDYLETVGYPYWVAHLENGGRRDIAAIDAWSGARVGSRGRGAILRAFLDASRIKPARGPAEPPSE